MPISRENLNVFCSDLITMVPKWNYFICMQIDYPRLPPGNVTKNSKNTKMTISQDPLVELIQLCARLFLVRISYIFAVWDSKMAAVTKNSAEHENGNISITA